MDLIKVYAFQNLCKCIPKTILNIGNNIAAKRNYSYKNCTVERDRCSR